ncbi:hypothetical protein MCEMSEM23_02899 [Rhabdaerophilaceae bacterium]
MVWRPLTALVIMIVPAFAHSWYPIECCSEKDCFPVPISDVKLIKGGWQLQDGTVVEHAEARPSPDGRFHVCRRQDGKGPLIRMNKAPACFWAPVMGS